ncbi:hypothetical protein KI688_005936 [Linnemannia hyalina]|uniref:Uncharacterized protein n=2 Tax=Linnemannia hyalina TaxID=64524 RepID=A0A9P7Y2S2_9FUNG|nr:hypothetical protein KI688_005936 [Linnemannia hyalina]
MAANTAKKNEDVGNKVVGALDALTLTSGRDEGAGMDVDVDMQETVGSDFMDAHAARGKMKEYSMQLATLTRQKMQLAARIQGLSQEEGDQERPKLAELTRQIAEAKTAMNEWNVMLDDLESAERSMGRTAFSSVVTREENEELGVKKGGKIDEIKLSNEFPRYHRLVEAHLLPVLDIKIHGPLITNVREFLYEFHRIGVTKFTTGGFDERCSRLLCLANMDRKASDAMNAVLSRDPEGKWPWARCEKVFVESAMTQTERTDEVEKVIKMGLERGESYKQYYHRMKRLMDVYQVKDLPKFADLLFLLQRAVDPSVLTMILLQKRIAVLEGMLGVAPDETTFESYMDSLQHMQGPADSDEWAPVILERRRLTGAADNEAARQAQSLKDKLINQQKRAAAAATLATTSGTRVGGTTGGSINQVPTAGDSSVQKGNAGFGGQRGAFGNGSGSGAPRGRGGSHGRGGYKRNFNRGHHPYPGRGNSNGGNKQ